MNESDTNSPELNTFQHHVIENCHILTYIFFINFTFNNILFHCKDRYFRYFFPFQVHSTIMHAKINSRLRTFSLLRDATRNEIIAESWIILYI